MTVVASRTTIPSFEGLYPQIAGPFQDMLKTEALQAPLPMQGILALLILCMWPLPVDKQVGDPNTSDSKLQAPVAV